MSDTPASTTGGTLKRILAEIDRLIMEANIERREFIILRRQGDAIYTANRITAYEACRLIVAREEVKTHEP